MSVADHLSELGIVLPPVFAPRGSYLGCRVVGPLAYVSGHGPVDGDDLVRGRIGAELDLAAGQRAARLTGLSILATLDAALPGGLDDVTGIVKVFGMVDATPGFDNYPAVIDGCSDLLVDVFGDAGRHARSAVGMGGLPFGIAVEIELVASVVSAG